MSTETTTPTPVVEATVETTPAVEAVVEKSVIEVSAPAAEAVTAVVVSDASESFIQTLLNNKDDVDGNIVSIGTDDMIKLKGMNNLNVTIASMDNASTNVITDGLVGMKVQMDDINPGKFDFQPGWIGRMIQKITGNTTMNKYVTKFQSANSIIDSIDQGLEKGKVTLKEDNVMFKGDKSEYRSVATSLLGKIEVLLAADARVDEKIATMEDGEDKKFLQEEVAYRLKQQIQDLQQTLVVTQQGVIAIDILIKNNDELIRSVNRVQRVTMAALSIGAKLAMGLANQKKVLDATTAINQGTSDLISANANALKTQGVAIQKQASGAMLDIGKLQTAIADTLTAIEDVESFKIAALPKMTEAIGQLNKLTQTVETKIVKIEKGEEINLLPQTEAKGA